MTSDYIALVKSYASLLFFGFRRCHKSMEDFNSLKFAFLAPFLYMVGFRGELKTPVGLLLVSNREVLRSFTYGFFKTYITYRRNLKIDATNLPTVVDVGANIGDFTLTVGSLAKTIVAVEPGGNNFSALLANIRINHMQNVIPVRAAAHDQREEVFLDGESSNMFISKDRTSNSVIGMPLDNLLCNLGISDIDIMKVDVQGHERLVLSGMNDLLSNKSVKFLIIEVHLKRGVTVNEIINFMKPYGYDLIREDPFLYDQPHLYFIPN